MKIEDYVSDRVFEGRRPISEARRQKLIATYYRTYKKCETCGVVLRAELLCDEDTMPRCPYYLDTHFEQGNEDEKDDR